MAKKTLPKAAADNTTQADTKSGQVRLEGSLTYGELAPVHGALTQAIEKNQAVTLDCSAVTSADIGLVQLILSARQTARAAGKSISLSAAAHGALLDVLTRGGFVSAPGCAPAIEQAFWLNQEDQ
jgi:ABC-type transporter Mla MlaB component